MKVFQAYFNHSGALAYEEASLQDIVSAHVLLSSYDGLVEIDSADRAEADYTIFEIEGEVPDFDIYAISDLPPGVTRVGHFVSAIHDVVEDLEDVL